MRTKLFILAALIIFIDKNAYNQGNLKAEIIPGTQIQGGIGQFADPTTIHGTTISMNGSLGASTKSKTFGYDVFNINARIVPGSNGFANRLAILVGFANWFTPALKSIYADSALSDIEKTSESTIVSSIMVGVSFRIGKSRVPTDDDWNIYPDSLEYYDLAWHSAPTDILKYEIMAKESAFIWKYIKRPAYRRPTMMIGTYFRIGSLGFESDVEVLDAYLSGAAGKGLFDIVGSFHYIKPMSKELIANNVFTGTIGIFVDLDNSPVFKIGESPNIRNLGLTCALGRYSYIEKSRDYIRINKYEYFSSPKTTRLDINLSINGLFGNVGILGCGIGFKYSYLWHSEVSDEHQFLIQFSSAFLSHMKK